MHPRQTAGFQEVRGESEWVSEWEEGGNEMGTGVERTKSLRKNWPSGSEEDGMHNEDGDEEDGMHNGDGDEEDEDDEDEDDDDDSDDEDGQLVPGFPPQVKRVVVPNTMEEDKGHIPVAIATPYEVVERRYACVIGIEKWERAAMLGAAMGAEVGIPLLFTFSAAFSAFTLFFLLLGLFICLQLQSPSAPLFPPSPGDRLVIA